MVKEIFNMEEAMALTLSVLAASRRKQAAARKQTRLQRREWERECWTLAIAALKQQISNQDQAIKWKRSQKNQHARLQAEIEQCLAEIKRLGWAVKEIEDDISALNDEIASIKDGSDPETIMDNAIL